jgi:hypothetical protein
MHTALENAYVKYIPYLLLVAAVSLAACGDDDETGDASAVTGDEDSGTVDASTTPTPAAGSGGKAGSTSSGGAGKAGSSAAGAGASAAGAGGAGSSAAGASGEPAAGAGGEPAAGSGGEPAAGSGGAGGRGGAAGRGPRAGRGGSVGGAGGAAGSSEPDADCPAAKPEEGAACEGIQGTMCTYDAVSCRCRNSEPIWTCSDAAGDAGSGGSAAGAGGRGGGFSGRGGGFAGGGGFSGFAGRGGPPGRGMT